MAIGVNWQEIWGPVWGPVWQQETVEVIPPVIITDSLAGATNGSPYVFQLEAAGTTPIEWTVEDGDLPTGMTLSSDGIISGTCASDDTYTFTVRATNTAGFDEQELSIVVAAGSGSTSGCVVLFRRRRR